LLGVFEQSEPQPPKFPIRWYTTKERVIFQGRIVCGPGNRIKWEDAVKYGLVEDTPRGVAILPMVPAAPEPEPELVIEEDDEPVAVGIVTSDADTMSAIRHRSVNKRKGRQA
jgi:hypothetical protein